MPLKVYRRGAVWHFRGSVAGRRLRGSTGAQDRETAQRIAAEREAAEWRRHLDGPAAQLTFAQAAIAYRDAGKADRFLARVEDYWKDTLVREITPGAIQQSARVLYPTGAAATRNRQVIVPTQAIINFAAELGWCDPIRVRRFKVNTAERHPAELAWVRAFAAQAASDGLPHLGALALFMFGTGCRVGEATALLWAEVDLAAARAFIRQTKTGHARWAHLPGEVLEALANIPTAREPDSPVFGYAGRGSVTKVWRAVCERAKIAPLTPHACRHGFATAMLRAGFDVATVAAKGGWKEASTVLRTYAHARSEKALTDALFGKNLTQRGATAAATSEKERRKS
ncbi:MAG: tyrosine-type recombinase/integrase [Roseicyclus sp.]|uniref:tyrosine-type recombinase/integrase n=1 Tax=Rhodosalinus sp. TaxID=2047741 RepID=UPI003979E24F